jgi:thioredoxin 1
MSSLTLQHDNRSELLDALTGDVWFVACLCAAWCDVCRQYRPAFEALAARHPDKRFVWIDVEDEADIVGDFDVDNFPTLLIQRGDAVAFFGTVLPDAGQAHRLVQAQAALSAEELAAQAQSTAERRQWQADYNLRARLADFINS